MGKLSWRETLGEGGGQLLTEGLADELGPYFLDSMDFAHCIEMNVLFLDIFYLMFAQNGPSAYNRKLEEQ